MKIVILASRAFHLAHLAREMAALGHQVTMYGYVPRFRMRAYRYGAADYRSRFLRTLPHSALALQRPFPNLCRRATDAAMPRIDRLVANELPECDVFIGLSGVALECFAVARKRGALTVCDRGSAHVLHQRDAITSTGTYGLTQQYIERELAGYEAAQYVVVPSTFAAQTFADRGYAAERIKLNPYGVDFTRFEAMPGSCRSAPRTTATLKALYVGAWTYQKGCDVLSQMLARHPEIQLTHIGMPGDVRFPSLQNFRTLGHVPNSQLAPHYAQHDVFVLASRQDGFGMVLLEALASGIPIVGSRSTGAPDIRDVVSDPAAVQVAADLTPDALADALRRARSAQRTGTSLLTATDKAFFSWNAYGRRYETFLLDALRAAH